MSLRRVALVLLVCGCAQKVTSSAPLAKDSPWPKFRRDLAQTALSPAKPLPGGKGFTFQTGKGIFSSAVIGGDGTIYIGSADRNFYALKPDGTVKWQVLTGEIIDSSALLDDTGGVYFGSGDGKLRGLDAATGKERWTTPADPPSLGNAVINWFEGNVGIGTDGDLFAGNDNFFLYGFERATGKLKWRFKMPDQTWSLPAVDTATGNLFVGNNNLVDINGDNTFGLSGNGKKTWSFLTKGTIAASPLLTKGLAIVGSFDGSVRAHDVSDGKVKWEFATRDHLYASPALLPNGNVIQASTDGTVYCLKADSGELVWTYELGEPIRSSPAVDADGNIALGAGDGRLWVIDGNGKLKWAIQLIDDVRNDLNGSPALGNDTIVIGGENGGVFAVPYDACTSSKPDARCVKPPTPDVTARGELRFVSGFGAVTTSAPPPLGATEPLTFELFVFDGSKRVLATLDGTALQVDFTPAVDVTTRVSGDGRYLYVEPTSAWPAATEMHVRAPWLVNHSRVGLKLSGGTVGGQLDARVALTSSQTSGPTFSVPTTPGTPQTLWEVSRLTLPTPTLLPSYNQIGFDSLHYILTPLEGSGADAVAVMLGARLKEGVNETELDPTTKAVIPLRLKTQGDAFTASIEAPLGLEVFNLSLRFESFRISARLPTQADGAFTSRVMGSTKCSTVPVYGVFLQQIGLCNPMSDLFSVSGATNVKTWQPAAFDGVARARGMAPTVTRTGEAFAVNVAAWRIPASQHLLTLVPVDPLLRRAMPVDVGLLQTQTTTSEGFVETLSLPVAGSINKAVRLHVLIDAQLVATLNLAP